MDGTQQLAALAQVLNVFEGDDIESWLFGGWAVDFHVGAVTRAHTDLDLAVWAADAERIAALLERAGWSHAPEEGEDGYTGYARDGVRLELAFLVRRDDGRVWTPLRDGFASWPPDAFGHETGELEGVRTRLIGAEALRAEKAEQHDDPLVARKDRADLAVLEAVDLRRPPESFPPVGDPQGTARGRERSPRTEVDPAPGKGSPYSAVVTLHGSHDRTTSGDLKRALAGLRGDVLLDLSDCEFIDSTVIELMIGKARALKREGSYLELLVEPASRVERALESLGIDELVTLHEHMPSDDLA